MTMQPDTLPFQAETKDLLDLMIHSLYTKREIFLRELISNASDALDRLRYESLSNPDLMAGDERLEIRLDVDPQARTLTISDTGIGMSREDVTRNLGTIARSGTKELRNKIKEEGGTELGEDLIGQFGVGFYSAYMVADRVEVITRKAGETTATRWESSADGFFTVMDDERETRGTSVKLYLRLVDSEHGIDDYTQTWRLFDIVRKHSDFIPYPIKFLESKEEVEKDDEGNPKEGAEKKAVYEDKTLNSMKPLWVRSQSDVAEEDYNEFYKHLTHDYTDPLKRIVAKAEGIDEYHTLLFIPSKAPFDLFYRDAEIGLRLYAKQVLISEKTPDLLPQYLRFIKGVVDVGEMPLNISRQQLQHDAHVTKIRKWLTKKAIDAIEAMHKKEEDTYDKFWAQFGRVIKEGVGLDFENKDRLTPLLRFASSNDPENLTTLDAYIERMKEGQEDIFYITGEIRTVLEKSPHLEALADRGYEVLFMTDPVDELMLTYFTEYKGKHLKSAVKGSLDVKEKEENKEEEEEKSNQFKPLLDFLQDNLKSEIKRAQLSKRLTKSPACLIVDEYDESPWMAQLLKNMNQEIPKKLRVLELNPDHPIVQKMLERVTADKDDAKLTKYANVLFGMALISEGAELNDPIAFTEATTELLNDALVG